MSSKEEDSSESKAKLELAPAAPPPPPPPPYLHDPFLPCSSGSEADAEASGQPSPLVAKGQGQQLRRRRRRSRNNSNSNSNSTSSHGRKRLSSEKAKEKGSEEEIEAQNGDSSSTEEGGDSVSEEEKEKEEEEEKENKGLESSPSRASGDPSVKRRKKRKKPADDYDVFLSGKSREISRLIHGSGSALDVEGLRKFALSRAGLVSDELRRQVWPLLVGIAPPDSAAAPLTLASQEACEGHREYQQVVLDVNRSLKRFPPGIADEDRPELQDQLTRLIVRVLLRHPELHYYQGYHDVAITFLLVVGEEMSYRILERLSISHLREFMAPTMENTTVSLTYIYPIIYRMSPELHSFLESSEVGTIFGLPWLITWFGHVLPEYEDVVRLYDFFLSQPPLMPVYLAAALVLHREVEILSAECDLAMVHAILSRIPFNLPYEKLLVDAQALYEDFPPSTLEKEVNKRIAKEKREREQLIRKRTIGAKSSSGGLMAHWPVVKKAAFVAVPVVLGFIVYRWYYTL